MWKARHVTGLDGVVGGIVDAHLHQWNPRRTPWAATRRSRLYRLAPPIGDRLFSLVIGQGDREYVLNPATVARAYEPSHYLADAAAVRTIAGVEIESVVYVESHWRGDPDAASPEDPGGRSSVEELRWVESLPFGVGRAPRLGAIVAHADPRAERFADLLDEHIRASPRFRGIRLITTRHPDPKVRSVADDDGVLASPEFLRGFAAVADRGLTFDVNVYSHQLYDVVTLAQEYPTTPLIVDHIGVPVGAFGPMGSRTGMTAAARADILSLWRERMSTLSAYPNVVIKLSGLALPVLGYGHQRAGNVGGRVVLTEMIGPLVEHLATRFGYERLMFGSNFPVDKPNSALDDVVGALIDILEPRGDHMLRGVFRDNAIRVYGIEG